MNSVESSIAEVEAESGYNAEGEEYSGDIDDDPNDPYASEPDEPDEPSAPDDDSDGGEANPVILDLTGQGIKITPLSSSNTFVKLGTDGYSYNTAWAGAGNAVLFYDPANSGTITQGDQIVFTDWDPTASSDMQALRDVFDTNHDGKLDAGDAGFASFKLMVTNADGTTSVETLAQAGITSINLVPAQANVVQIDGSTVTGQTTYTRTDGTTGTAADVTLATDTDGAVVKQTVTQNANGSTTIDNKSYDAGGDLASDETLVTAANGNRTLTWDDNGDGVIDRKQVDNTSTSNGVTNESVKNYTDGGTVLADNTFTTTSTSGGVTTVTILRDLDGGGIIQQKEVRVTNADGSTTDTVTNVSKNATVANRTLTTTSADGLTKTTKTDIDGNGTYDLVTTDATTVNAGVRTETVTDTIEGVTQDDTTTTISADGQTKTVLSDPAGIGGGNYYTKEVSQTVTNGDGSSTTTVSDYNYAYNTLRDQSITTVSADGLTKTVQADLDGNGTIDRVTTDGITNNPDGSRTETVTMTNGNGSVLLSKSSTVQVADGISRTITVDATGDVDSGGNPIPTSVETIYVTANTGAVTDDLKDFAANGSLLGHTVTTTSADGLSRTVQEDHTGTGTYDRSLSDVTVNNGNGSTETVKVMNGAGTVLLGQTVTTTSANGLTKTVATDLDGDGTADRTTTDTTVVNGDNSLTETVVTLARDLTTTLSKTTTTTSPDRRIVTITRDDTGDGTPTHKEVTAVADNGTTTDTTTDYKPDGLTEIDQQIVTTSANGLSTTTQADHQGHGYFDLVTTDVTALQSNGNTVETVTDYGGSTSNGGIGAERDQTVTTKSANGLSIETQHDYDGDGTYNLTTNDVTTYGVNGPISEAVTDTNADGSKRDQTVTTTSGNGLSTTITHDFDGDGTVDLTTTDTTVLNPVTASTGFIKTETVTNTNMYGQRDRTVTNTSADGKNKQTRRWYYGSVNFSETETATTAPTGATSDVLNIYSVANVLLHKVAVTRSANGLSTTTQTDVNGDGTYDLKTTDITTLTANGGTVETVTDTGNALTASPLTIDKTITTITGNGLSKTVQVDRDGDGQIDLTTTDVTVLNQDGSTTETVTATNRNGTQIDQSSTTTSHDRKTVTTTSTFGADGTRTDQSVIGADGTDLETITAQNANLTALGTSTLSTSANGGTTIATFVSADGTQTDSEQSVLTINLDGSRTVVVTDNVHGSQEGATSNSTTTTTANGLGVSKSASMAWSDASSNGRSASFSYLMNDTTVMNQDGSNTETITDTGANGTALNDSLTITLSADGLTKTSALNETGIGPADITDTTLYTMDGSKFETLTVFNTADKSRVQQDYIVTSADGRTTTLESARDGDWVPDHFETTVTNPDGTISDYNRTLIHDGAPVYYQSRLETLNTDGSRTATITDTDGTGRVQDVSVVTTSANGLSQTTATQTTGSGTADLNTTDTTVLNADGSKTEIIQRKGTYGTSLPHQGVIDERIITTSADGRTVTTEVDNDGNGIFETSDQVITATDGTVTETSLSFNNLTGAASTNTAADGSTASRTVSTTSPDGLVKTVVQGTVTATTTLIPDANGSYAWEEKSSGSQGVLGSATHFIDANRIDTWSYTDASGTTTTQIDTASESRAIGQADSIYQAVLGRSMQDGEQQALVAKYISGGSLNRIGLIDHLLGLSAYTSLGTQTFSEALTRVYENLFGHLPSAAELSTYAFCATVDPSASNHIDFDQEVDDLARKATDEAGGNGLLEIIPGAATLTPTSVSELTTPDQTFSTIGSTYEGFVNTYPTATTQGISAFETLMYQTTSGVTTQQGSNWVTATSGSTKDEWFYGTGQTINTTTSGLNQLTDTGSGNTLNASNGTNIRLTGAANDTLIGSSVSSTLLALGNNEQVTTGSGTTSVIGAGSNTNVNAAAGTSDIVLSGANSTVTGATSSSTISVETTGAQVGGSGAAITFLSGSSGEVSGSSNTISSVGSTTLTLDASGSTLNADTGDVITVTGTSDTINGANETVTLMSGSSVTLNGHTNIVVQNSSTTLTAIGESDFVDVDGTGVNDSLTDATLALDPGGSLTLGGSNDTVIAVRDKHGVSGAIITDNGMNDTAVLDENDGAIVNSEGASVQANTNGTIALAGTISLGSVTLTSGVATVTFGNNSGNKATISGVSNVTTVQYTDSSGNVTTEQLTDTAQQMTSASHYTVSGLNVLDTLSSSTFDVLSGAGLSLSGSSNTFTMESGSINVALAGSSNTVSGANANNVTSYVSSGSGNSLTFGEFAHVTDGGSSNSITVGEGSEIDSDLTTGSPAGNNDTIAAGQTTLLKLTGTGYTINASSGDSVNASSSTINLATGANLVVNGTSDTINNANAGTVVNLGASASATLNGTSAGATINASNGDVITVSNSVIDVAAGATVTITGTGDIVNLSSSGQVNLTGSNFTVTNANAGTTVNLTANTSAVVNGSGGFVGLLGSGVALTTSNENIGAVDNATSENVGGSDNTLTVGNGFVGHFYGGLESVTFNGSNDLVGLTGNAPNVVNNDNATDEVDLGVNTTATVNGTGGLIVLAGSGDMLTTSNETIEAVDNATSENVAGTGDTFTLGNGFQGHVYGASETVTYNGTNDVVSLIGSGTDTVSGNNSSNETDLGAGITASVSGSGGLVTINGNGDNLTLSANQTVFTATNMTGEVINGSSDAINTYNGFNGTINGSTDNIAFHSYGTMTVNGNNDSIQSGNIGSGYSHLTTNGSGDTVTVTSGFGFAGNMQVVQTAIQSGAVDQIGGQGIDVGSVAQADDQLLDVIADQATSPVLEGGKWNQSVVTWTASSALDSAEVGDVQTAFAVWSKATGLTFEQVSDPAKADIDLGTADLNSATTGLVGLTSYQIEGGTFQPGVSIAFEDPSKLALVAGSDGELTYTGTQASFTQVAEHEIGHALGFGDNAGATSVESYYLGAGNRTLDDADLAAAHALYQPAAGGPPASSGPAAPMNGNAAASGASTTDDAAPGDKTTAGLPADPPPTSPAGHSAWVNMFDALSRSLGETDQYGHNAQNQPVRFDLGAAAGGYAGETFYDPQAIAEIGFHQHGLNATFEAADASPHHDWLTASNASLDKAAQTTRQAQAALHG